jgi:hypothetical protein
MSPATALRIAIGAAALASTACQRQAPPPPPTAEVLVVRVAQQDVAIYSEAVGTTEGFINAQVHARVQGYLLRQAYVDGALEKSG